MATETIDILKIDYSTDPPTETKTQEEREIVDFTEAVPVSIARRQFFQQAAIKGIITEDEALDAMSTGAIPSIIASFIALLPAEQQFGAKALIKGAASFERDHAMVSGFATYLGSLTPPVIVDVDQFWIAAGKIR